MINAKLLRSRMSRKAHVRFWSRVRRGDLPGLDNEVISMVPMKGESGNLERKFVCHTLNANMYPAKDRSGCLNEIEEAHLGKLLAKIKKGK